MAKYLVDTSSFQLGAPDYDSPAEAEEEAQWLRDLADRALGYITAFDWAPPVRDILLAFGVGEVIGLFLVRFERPVPAARRTRPRCGSWWATSPRSSWPPSLARPPRRSISTAIAEDRADKVLAGADLSEAFPISAAPTREHAAMLKSRLEFIGEKFIPLAGARDRIAAEPI